MLASSPNATWTLSFHLISFKTENTTLLFGEVPLGTPPHQASCFPLGFLSSS